MTRASLKRLGVIGYPIRHSISPAFQQAALDHLAIPARYDRYEVSPHDLPTFVESVRGEEWLGVNVTIPHKQAVIPLLDETDAMALAIGSVNTVLSASNTLGGQTTDNIGFVRALAASGCRLAGVRAVILGTGGTARPIAAALLQEQVCTLMVLGRSPSRAAAVLDLAANLPTAVHSEYGWGILDPEVVTRELAGADLLVNTTPIGMRGGGADDESPVPAEALHPGLTVFDAVYNPIDTPLLRLARTAGARTVSGLDMLVYQGAESFRLWTGQDAPIEIMMRAARAALSYHTSQQPGGWS